MFLFSLSFVRCGLWTLLVGLLATGMVLAGCNRSRTVTVTGTVLKSGQPLAVSPTGALQVTLIPDLTGDQAYTTRIARCEKDGSFKIPEVLPGKYKIGVEQWDPNPQIDKLSGAFRPGDSKVVRELDGKTPLTIDLAKPNLGL
jgi:hypothetical protein